MTTTATQIATYIRSKMDLMGEMQLQKLVYYSQAWSLAWDGRPLFEEPIEAWRMGPVVRSLRHGEVSRVASPGPIGAADAATVDAVIAFYGRHHGGELSDMTHAELPWAEVWEKRTSFNSCDDEIPHESMRRYYTRLALTSSDIPQRSAVVVSDASHDDVLWLAAGNAQRWRDTLAILAQ